MEKITDIFYCIHNAFIGKRQIDGEGALVNEERQIRYGSPLNGYIGKRLANGDRHRPFASHINGFFGREAEEQTGRSKREYRPGAHG